MVISPRAFYAEVKTIPLMSQKEKLVQNQLWLILPVFLFFVREKGLLVKSSIMQYLEERNAELQGTEDPEVKEIKVLCKDIAYVEKTDIANSSSHIQYKFCKISGKEMPNC